MDTRLPVSSSSSPTTPAFPPLRKWPCSSYSGPCPKLELSWNLPCRNPHSSTHKSCQPCLQVGSCAQLVSPPSTVTAGWVPNHPPFPCLSSQALSVLLPLPALSLFSDISQKMAQRQNFCHTVCAFRTSAHCKPAFLTVAFEIPHNLPCLFYIVWLVWVLSMCFCF